MAYTLTTATTEVRQLINEETTGFWSDTEIQNWIKMGCIDTSTKTQCVKHRDYFALATDTQVYEPSDFNTNSSDVLVRIQYAWPIPTSSENGNKVHIFYSYATDAIANIKWHLQILPIWFAVAMAKAKDEQFAQADMWLRMYLNAASFERRDKYDKGTETSQEKKVW